MTETTNREHLWKPGQSGNPNGRPKGARHKATLAAEALFDGEAETLSRKCVEAALSGDPTALRLALERILPPRKERPVAFKLPPLRTASDAVTAMACLAAAVGDGSLTPGEAEQLGRLVESFVKSVEAHDVQERLAALEAQAQSRGSPL